MRFLISLLWSFAMILTFLWGNFGAIGVIGWGAIFFSFVGVFALFAINAYLNFLDEEYNRDPILQQFAKPVEYPNAEVDHIKNELKKAVDEDEIAELELNLQNARIRRLRKRRLEALEDDGRNASDGGRN